MYACGLRISEATTLEVTAVDGANLILHIIGKGDKERRVPLPQPVLDELRDLWRTHRNPRWLFPNPAGPTAQPACSVPHLPAAARTAGIRTGSRRMLSGTAMRPGFSKAVSAVQILLGHVNIATTAVYTHLTEPTRISLEAFSTS